MDGKIQNCQKTIPRPHCLSGWSALEATEVTEIKICQGCGGTVYLVDSNQGLGWAIRNGERFVYAGIIDPDLSLIATKDESTKDLGPLTELITRKAHETRTNHRPPSKRLLKPQ